MALISCLLAGLLLPPCQWCGGSGLVRRRDHCLCWQQHFLTWQGREGSEPVNPWLCQPSAGGLVRKATYLPSLLGGGPVTSDLSPPLSFDLQALGLVSPGRGRKEEAPKWAQ